ncbi:MAG: Fic family protein [Selenomonadaceae bacterium]|nr:Fic family protein [Selenomonadaceae bacterium]
MKEYSVNYINDLMVRMAHHSTAIEGNTLSQGETKSILIDNYLPRAMNMRELYEVLNYKTFIPFLLESLEQERRMDIGFIKEVHRILCNNAIESVPGEFKVTQNMVIGADFTPTPPYMVGTKLTDWQLNLEFMLANAKTEKEKVEAICRQHIEFEYIHPFPDGNGRVGRALMVYTCMLCDMPPIVIPVKEKAEYINYLNTENINGFVEYCLKIQKEEIERENAVNNC